VKWTISKKIIATFGLAMLILFGVGAATYYSTAQLLHMMDLRRSKYEVEITTERLALSLTDAETGQRGYVITGVKDYLEPHTSGVKEARVYLDQLNHLFSENPGMSENLKRLKEVMDQKFAELDKTIGMRETSFEVAAAEIQRNVGKQYMDEIRSILEKVRTIEHEESTKLDAEANQSAAGTFRLIIAGNTAAIIFMFVGTWLLARNISEPLAEMTTVSRRIASGELGGRFEVDGRSDEVGELRSAFSKMNVKLGEISTAARSIADGDLRAEFKPQSESDEIGTSFATMQKNLRDVMRQTLETVNVLSTSASEINASVSQVAAGASETAAAITETTATVEEVKQTAELNNDKVKQVADGAQRSAQTAELGRQSVEGAVSGMNRIRQQTEAIGTSMVRLSEQTLAVGEIIATVNDLAEQSNILAVNAAIEAAKAGEQGKGFAVVAQEVRSLAEQSKQATNQVRSILSEIQKATSAAMIATEQGSKAVNAGLEQSEQAGRSISALAENISRSAQAAMQIAASSQQQVAGMDQVAMAIRNIQEASVQNAAAVKQVQESSRALSDLGRKLKTLVERYQT